MSGRSLTQREASHARRIAQFAAIAAALLALAALVFRLPGLGDAPASPGPIQWPDIKPPADPQAGKPTPSHDMNAAAARLALVSNKPKPAAPQPEPTEVPNPNQPNNTEIKYLGAVLEPTRKIALLRVGEKQRMIAEGKSIAMVDGGTLEVVTIDAEGVVIRDAQGERRVEKSARTASAVTTITDAAAAPAVPPSPDDAAEAGGNEDMQRRRMEAEARMKALRDRTKAGGRNP
ncbi:MAG: hypothetical protein IT434_04690 [Phycisphaerales bacterium]|jgi:hypothetical protein|nr:hypothetical protein [Phycisphaerales bacterium]